MESEVELGGGNLDERADSGCREGVELDLFPAWGLSPSTAVSAGIQMEKALGLYKHLSFLFIYSLSDRFTKNL